MLDHDRLFALVCSQPVGDQVKIAIQVAQLVTDSNDPLPLSPGRMFHFGEWRTWAARWTSDEDRTALSARRAAKSLPPAPEGPAGIARNAALAAASLAEIAGAGSQEGEKAQAASDYAWAAIQETLGMITDRDDAWRLLEGLVA